LTWGDAASIRIKLKVPATQRHHLERAARPRWLAILQVPFLYGLPTYIEWMQDVSDTLMAKVSYFSSQWPVQQ